jgi:hypothetical protein
VFSHHHDHLCQGIRHKHQSTSVWMTCWPNEHKEPCWWGWRWLENQRVLDINYLPTVRVIYPTTYSTILHILKYITIVSQWSL